MIPTHTAGDYKKLMVMVQTIPHESSVLAIALFTYNMHVGEAISDGFIQNIAIQDRKGRI